MGTRRLLISLIAVWMLSCDRRNEPADRANHDHAEPTRPFSATDVATAIRAARTRLERDRELPPKRGRESCPDETLTADSEDARTLVVRVRDGRDETRSLLPLKLLASLESDEFSALRSLRTEGAAGLGNMQRIARSDESARRALEVIEILERRPYLAEIVVESLVEPRLFRRKKAPRSEWSAGHLVGRLVVYELRSERGICQAPLKVNGDLRGATIRHTLRERTRERLLAALLDRTWSAAEAALSAISFKLRFPHTESRGDPAQRWAASEELAYSDLQRSESGD